jgi:hypothetical protein
LFALLIFSLYAGDIDVAFLLVVDWSGDFEGDKWVETEVGFGVGEVECAVMKWGSGWDKLAWCFLLT